MVGREKAQQLGVKVFKQTGSTYDRLGLAAITLSTALAEISKLCTEYAEGGAGEGDWEFAYERAMKAGKHGSELTAEADAAEQKAIDWWNALARDADAARKIVVAFGQRVPTYEQADFS